MVIPQFKTQHVVDRFGQKRALPLTQGIGLAVITKKFRHHRICRVIKLEYAANQVATSLEK